MRIVSRSPTDDPGRSRGVDPSYTTRTQTRRRRRGTRPQSPRTFGAPRRAAVAAARALACRDAGWDAERTARPDAGSRRGDGDGGGNGGGGEGGGGAPARSSGPTTPVEHGNSVKHMVAIATPRYPGQGSEWREPLVLCATHSKRGPGPSSTCQMTCDSGGVPPPCGALSSAPPRGTPRRRRGRRGERERDRGSRRGRRARRTRDGRSAHDHEPVVVRLARFTVGIAEL